MSEWKEIRLGDVIELLDNKRIPLSSNERSKRQGKYPYYGAQGIIDYIDDYIFDGKYLLIAEDGENLKSRKNPIAFIIKGKFWVNNHAHIITNNDKSILEFIYYIANYIDITSYVTGSAQPKLNQTNLKNIKINLPPLPIQKKIADILSVIDEKIEILQNINSTLEEMAKAIFKSWFVDFDITKAKASGKSDDEIAKEFGINKEIIQLFPSEFETSEIGEIPKGWEVRKLGELISIKSGKRPKNKQKQKNKEFKIPIIGATSITGYTNIILYNEKIIVIGRVGTHGIVQRINFESWISDNAFIIKSNYEEFIYQFLQKLNFNVLNKGTTQPLITQTDIKNIKCIFNKVLFDFFEKKISIFFNQIQNNTKQIQTLQQTRDTLLPKLINGEIEVDELDIRGIE